jgi:hypothetical protein
MKTIYQFTSWGPSKFADYEMCPHMALHKHLKKTCTICFKGKVLGGYDTPAICDTCGKENEKGPALVKGDRIGKEVDAYLTSRRSVPLPDEIRHPAVLAILKEARSSMQYRGKKKPTGEVQIDSILDLAWKPVQRFARRHWFWGKIDYRKVVGTVAEVIDWKTGGLDKNTGAVRPNHKYGDQLSSYAVATLCECPEVQEVHTKLVFLECAPRFEAGQPGGPVVEGETLTRAALAAAQTAWKQKLRPMLFDKDFAPRPGDGCWFCPYSKKRGGPCKH